MAFTVAPADVEELEEGEPVAVATENARRKAARVAAEWPGAVVLGVDTVVALHGRIYGKPHNPRAAAATLRALSGRAHQVVSGLALTAPGAAAPEVTSAVTRVTFRTLSDATIRWYLETREWQDRAGGYAIQGRGAALIAGIHGDYLNVVGLPVAQLLDRAPWLVWGAR